MAAQKIDALTGLRFFAAISIVLHHLHGFGLPHEVLAGWPLDNGVGFFFVLSGFILTYVYPRIDTPQARNRFWVARVARIWPAHIVALLLCYALLDGDPSRFATGVDTFALGLANISLLHAWIPYPETFFSYNNVSWSISTELFFYLAFPFLIQRLGQTWWYKLGAIALLTLALVVGSKMADLKVFTSMDQGLTVTGVVYIHPLARIFEFMLGMCAAVLLPVVSTQIKDKLNLMTGTVLELAAIGLLVVNWHLSQQFAHWLSVNFGFAGVQWVGQGGGLSLGFAVLILITALHSGVLSRIIGSKPFVLLGEISFMIYMIHYVVLRAYVYRAETFKDWPGEGLLALYLFIICAGSWALWRYVEMPARKLVLRAFDKRQTPA